MINILPYRQKKMVAKIRLMRLYISTVIALSILVLVAGALLLPILVSINGRYSIANEQISRLEQSGAVANPVDVAALEERVSVLRNKLAGDAGASPIGYISVVRQRSLSGITLTGFDASDVAAKATLRVAGIAATREALQQFVASLGKDETILSVDSPVSNYVKSTNSNFLITITFK